ncbi:MAG: co-chaperone GroES [Deltaproteobacteria bacterium]
MSKKELIIIGDRVLIRPQADQEKTTAGLYLPAGVYEKEKVQAGTIAKVGPGYPIPDPATPEIEPWQTPRAENRYIPLQVKEGDMCIFLRSAGIEIEYDQEKFIVIPQSSILVVLREGEPPAPAA